MGLYLGTVVGTTPVGYGVHEKQSVVLYLLAQHVYCYIIAEELRVITIGQVGFHRVVLLTEVTDGNTAAGIAARLIRSLE